MVLEISSLPAGELLSGAADRPPVADRAARRLALVALALLVVGSLQASDLRQAAAVEGRLADVVDVTAVISAAALRRTVTSASTLGGSAPEETGVIEISVTVRNSARRPVRLRDARITPPLAAAVPGIAGVDLPAGGSSRVELSLAPDCSRLEELTGARSLAVTVVAGSGRRQQVVVAIGSELTGLARGACRRQPLAESLLLSAHDVTLESGQLRFQLGFSRDTLRGGSLTGLRARGLRVTAPDLPQLLPLSGRDPMVRVDVLIEIADCRQLTLNPRGFLLTLAVEIADGSGRRSTVFTGIGDSGAPLNRLAAGLLAKGCGFDPLFRTA